MLLCLVYTYFLFLSLSVIAWCFVSFILVCYSFVYNRRRRRRCIKAGGFWLPVRRHECAFFDVRVFHPHARSYRHRTIQQTFRTHEQEKRRAYETRIQQVDGVSFTPLVFTTAGGAGPAASVFLKHLGNKIAEKKEAPYSQTIGWLRCRLSFALLRASILCIRGSRSLKQADQRSCQPDLAVAEGRILDI